MIQYLTIFVLAFLTLLAFGRYALAQGMRSVGVFVVGVVSPLETPHVPWVSGEAVEGCVSAEGSLPGFSSTVMIVDRPNEIQTRPAVSNLSDILRRQTLWVGYDHRNSDATVERKSEHFDKRSSCPRLIVERSLREALPATKDDGHKIDATKVRSFVAGIYSVYCYLNRCPTPYIANAPRNAACEPNKFDAHPRPMSGHEFVAGEVHRPLQLSKLTTAYAPETNGEYCDSGSRRECRKSTKSIYRVSRMLADEDDDAAVERATYILVIGAVGFVLGLGWF